ncbi:CarD family transcriptional regulator [Oceanobacillus rekensis]|uniref:CarD family transcriptional regulator n=1 Tax=Oceanobacillus rekensis TaxID=937927 RepID=UPI000B441258|nr:CarD family transcriptional regulator [Oceanobacillus rekensis]
MFNIGDTIIYSIHGLSEIDDICEKTYGNVTRTYYVLHPLEDPGLTINTPVDNNQVVMLTVLEKKEAEDILQSFQQLGISWIEDPRQRYREYNRLINTGERKEISKVVNTLMRKNQELNRNKKKMYDQDRSLLIKTQKILFKELAVSLNTSYEDVSEKISSMISLQK